MSLEGCQIKNWNLFKRKMEELGYQEVGSSVVPYQAYKYAKKGPQQTAFSKVLNKEVDVPYVFEKRETKIKKIDRVVVFVEKGKIDQVRLKFEMQDWPYKSDLNIIYPEHRKLLPPELENLAKEIEEEVKEALS
ncbi:MAG: hypothetical protein QXQ69_03325 [Candidatus Aenigmatarchaeota archaeon]